MAAYVNMILEDLKPACD